VLSDTQRRFVSLARVARLATSGPSGQPHVVPVCPALEGDRIAIASEPGRKVKNLRENPRASIVFDAYHEDWDANHQVGIAGSASVVSDGPDWELGKRLLDQKYPQYEPMYPITAGQTLVIWIEIERVTTSEGV
jgi:PPOX class probable F420-dependent enzyme